MAKIRKIYDQAIKPDGSKLTIYPITSTRAVYTPESITMEALINEGYRFGGVIEHLEDSPEFTDQRVFYLADKVGVYPNFGNLTLAGGELGVFCYNKSQWIKGILKGGGTNLTGYQVVTSASLLPDEESTIGYIIGTDLYVWVGEGGDTKEGKYKNVGPFVGPQGNGIEQVFLSPTNYKLTIDFTDGTSWTSEQSIRGIAGAKGDKGDPGLTGAAGATGPKGNKGDKGDSGVSLGDVVLTADLDETETGKALDASAMQTIPHWVDEEQEIEDVPSNYYTRTQTDQKLLNHKAEVNQHLTNQDNDIARLEDRIDNMVDGVDEFIHHRPTVINNGTIINAPDDEDLVATEENTLKFADRPAINAMGYVILRKNKTFAEQVTATNTIYEIRYDFGLGGESVTIPENCVLKFVGGSLSNGALVGQNTRIEAGLAQIFDADITLGGTWNVQYAYPEWFISDFSEDITAAVNRILSFHNSIYFSEATYKIDGTIVINKKGISIKGRGVKSTIITHAGANALFEFDGDVRNFKVTDISLYGTYNESNPVEQIGISIDETDGCSDCIFDNVEFFAFKYAIKAKDRFWANVIQNCMFERNYCGIYVFGTSGSSINNVLIKNTFSRNLYYAVWFTYAKQLSIINNNFGAEIKEGRFLLLSGQNVYILNCNFERSSSDNSAFSPISIVSNGVTTFKSCSFSFLQAPNGISDDTSLIRVTDSAKVIVDSCRTVCSNETDFVSKYRFYARGQGSAVFVENDNNETNIIDRAYSTTNKIVYHSLDNYCTQDNRPSVKSIGYVIFDTTLNKPIWWNGSSWVDATGTAVE